MSPIDPRELGHGLTAKGIFEDGYRCVKCNYDLSGLPQGTVCPECGTTNARISHDKKRGTGVSRAPVAYVSRLTTWLWVTAFTLIAMWFSGFVTGMVMYFTSSPAPVAVAYGFQLLVAVGWVVALWMATHPKPDRYEPGQDDVFDNHKLRMAMVASQALWVVSMLLYTASAVPPLAGVSGGLELAGELAEVLAAAGFVPLGIMLASLANWMGDDDQEGRCRTASWLIAFHGVGTLLATFLTVVGIFYVVFWIAYLVGVVLLAMSLFNLARAGNWAVQNAKHKSVVSGRRAVIDRQRAVAAEERLQDRMDAMDNPASAHRAGRKAPPQGVPVPKSHTIDRPEDTDPYEVKDE